jgi:hypothetical protein
MSGPVSIADGGLVTKDSSESLVYTVDYDSQNLAPGVLLASAGTYAISPSGLTQDNQSLAVGSRITTVRLSGGTVGRVYRIEHTVSTNETPAQTLSKHWRLLIT